MSIDFNLEKIAPKDVEELRALAIKNDGNVKLLDTNFEQWYFKNPSNSSSLWKVVVDEKIEGYATTNNFNFTIENKPCKVAMPQNVLTSTLIRGMGLFNKLYFKTETENIEEKKIDYFLTFTNELSTPIFIKKFNYKAGKCPNVILNIFNPIFILAKKNYKRLTTVEEINPIEPFVFNNAMEKTLNHFKWRYNVYEKNKIHIVEVYKNEIVVGYSILLVDIKKGVKFLILADIICDKQENAEFIIDTSKKYCFKNLFPLLVMFQFSTNFKKGLLSIVQKNRFNFLVKGKSEADTEMLSKTDFTFFFGDLDIV
jgi:hypothetical protein